MLPDLLRWAALAAITAAMLRLPRPLGFWSQDVGRPLVLARATAAHGRFRQIVGF